MAELITHVPHHHPQTQVGKPAPDADLALVWLCLAFVLLLACVSQLLGLKWRRWFPGAESEKSLFKGVRAGVYTFLSHLN